MLFVLCIYFPSAHVHGYYVGSLFGISCVHAILPCETSH